MTLKSFSIFFFLTFILLNLNGCEPHELLEKKTITSETLSIVTINMWGLPSYASYGTYSRKERARALCEHLKTQLNEDPGYDVILVQEARGDVDEELMYCGYDLYSADYYNENSFLEKRLYDTGLLILSRLPASKIQFHLYPKHEFDYPFLNLNQPKQRLVIEAQRNTDRGVFLIEMNHHFIGKITIGNTHLIPNYFEIDLPLLKERELELREFFTTSIQFSKKNPLVIGGDLNIDENADIFDQNARNVDQLWIEREEHFPGFDYSKKLDRTCSFCTPYSSKLNYEGRLDHILGGNNLIAIDGKILFKDGLPSKKYKKNIIISDHYGVWTLFKLKQNQ
ncbi:MAG: hypothetical protein CL678_11030 [Bdellovibrionaceae bacterium]|nr:hypothetical protein [Pseudobdellovibrionaceae bacterium]|tara:strand:+ start:840 stop:1853 length:1014 start_codon:yes stop_codon:yes gene_type:complete